MMTSKLTAWLGVALIALEAAGPAFGAACFQPADIEAEQAIRYQTELMVLSDTCDNDSYRDFTVRNRGTIISYQSQLIEHFRRTGARSPRASLDTFLTQMANELALHVAREPAHSVCGRSATLFDEARRLDGDQFRRHVAALAVENGKGYRRCTN